MMTGKRSFIWSRGFHRPSLRGLTLSVFVLAGCAFDGPQDAGDIAGRQAAGSPPAGITASTVLDIAERTRAAGDYASAISFYRRAHAMSADDPRPLTGLGETLNLVGATNEAVEAYRQALQLASSNADALRGLGITLVALNQPAAAVDEFNKALAIAPEARAFGGLGVAEDLLGDYKSAEAAYRSGLALAPNDLTLRNNFGLSLALQGNYKAAIEILRAVATDAAAGPRHRLNLALVLGLAGRDSEAGQVARIDLDERSVRSNLAYYAELRELAPRARAQAILQPNASLRPPSGSNSCLRPPCSGSQVGESNGSAAAPAKLSANPVAPVASQPLPSVAPSAVPRAGDPLPKRKAATRTEVPPASPEPSASAIPDAHAPPEATNAPPAAPKGGAETRDPASGEGGAALPDAAEKAATMPPASRSAAGPRDERGLQVSGTPAQADNSPSHAASNAVSVPETDHDGSERWIQVAAVHGEARAERVWVGIARRNQDLVGSFSHSVSPIDLGPRHGIYYRVLVGPLDNVESARDLCSALKGRHVGCSVVPTS